MVQFFQQSGYGSPGQQFGQAIAGGFQQGLQSALNDYLGQKDRLDKGRPQILGYVDKIFKQFDPNERYDSNTRRQVFNNAIKSFEGGQDAFLAVDNAFKQLAEKESFSSKESEKAKPGEQKEREGFFSKLSGEKFGKKSSNPFAIQNLVSGAKEGILSAEKGLREKEARAKEAEKTSLTKVGKRDIAEIPYQELLKLPQSEISKLSQQDLGKLGQRLAEGAQLGTQSAFTQQFLPVVGPLAKRAEQNLASKGVSPIPQPNEFTEAPISVAKATGEVLKDLAIFGRVGALTAGAPTAAKIGAQGAAQVAEKASRVGIEEGRTPTEGEILSSFAFGAIPEAAGPAIKGLWNTLKRIPDLAKTVKAATGGTKATQAAKGGKGVSKAVEEAVGPAGLTPEEEIVGQAAKQAAQRGVDIDAAVAGDAKSLNELKKETERVAGIFQKADKFNAAELEKIRADVAKKLPESPLAKYYEPTVKEPKTPAGQAAKAERIKPLQEKIKQDEQSLRSLQREILANQGTLRNAKAQGLTPEAIARIEAKIAADQYAHQQLLRGIKNAEFEIKWGRPPRTSEEIQKDITKSFDEIRKGIKDPNAEKIEKIRKQLAKDQSAIETAQRLAERGELPGPQVFDEFVKVHKEYQKAYKELAKELKDFAKANKGTAEGANAQNLAKLVEEMQAANQAKIANQIDKRKALHHLERPSGAFYKEMLKDLKKEVAEFQRPLFKWHQYFQSKPELAAKIVAPGKIEKLKHLPPTSKEGLKNYKEPAKVKPAEVAKDAKEAAKNPTPENLDKIAKETGASKEDLGALIKENGEKVKEAAKAVENGTATKETEAKVVKSFLKSRHLSRLAKSAKNSIVLGAAQALLEEYFDVKLPIGVIGALGGGGLISRGGGAVGSGLVYKYITNAFEKKEAEKLHSLTNSSAFDTYYEGLRKRYGDTKAKRIHKKAMAYR